MARTQEQRKAQTRALLLDAAADLFARRGFHGVSADAVAQAADRTSGALYSHFASKEGLLLALLEAWKEHTAADILERLDAAADVDARLEALWTRFASPPADEDAWMLLEHELFLYAARNAEARPEVGARYAGGARLMGKAFDEWVTAAGANLPLPAEQVGALVVALLVGLDMQRRVDRTAVPDDMAIAGLRLLLGLDGHHPTREDPDGAA